MTCMCRHREEVDALLPPIHNLTVRRRWVISTTLRPLYPQPRPWYPLYRKLSGAGLDGTENL
jgi:hypothetical protein